MLTGKFEDILVDDDYGICTITLNRPERRNALRRQTFDELERVLRDPRPRVYIVTGSDPGFCSGDDVRDIMQARQEGPEPAPSAPRLTPAADALLFNRRPVIAAVNGPAVGWGMELALLADMRVASERASFGELFVERGLVSDVAGLGRLTQLVGREVATELLMTGRPVTADEARELGIVRRVVPHDALLTTARDLADQLASKSGAALAAIKEGMRRALDPDWASLGHWVSGTLGELFATDEHRESVRAFLAGREAG